MQNLAQGYLVFALTKSELWLGIVACAMGLPMLLVAPFAGVFVERLPRRRVLFATQLVAMTLAFILAALVFTNTVQVWHVIVLALILGVNNAFDAPSRMTFISDLVSKEHLASGIAMNSIIVNGSRVFGPTMAGFFLTLVGPAWCFLLNGVSFIFVIISLVLMRFPAFVKRTDKAEPLRELREGLRYVQAHEVVLPLLLLSATAGFFGWANLSLFPAFSAEVLNAPEEGYALISAANGLGAVFAGLLVTPFMKRLGRGQLMALMLVLTGVSLALLSQTTMVISAAVMSLLMGFSIIAFLVACNTSVQLAIESTMRGRVMSLYTLSIMGLNPFGSLVIGAIAEQFGNPAALLIYGCIFTLLGGAVLLRYPRVRQIGRKPSQPKTSVSEPVEVDAAASAPSATIAGD
jgi:MFS family permease